MQLFKSFRSDMVIAGYPQLVKGDLGVLFGTNTQLKKILEGEDCHLDKDKVEQLEAIAFDWVLRSLDESREKKFEMWLQFCETHGHCDVPQCSKILKKAWMMGFIAKGCAYKKANFCLRGSKIEQHQLQIVGEACNFLEIHSILESQ